MNPGKLPFEKERELLIRREEETNPDFGCLPNERSIEDLLKGCIINIDKPAGPTSAQVSDFVKDILGIRKCGHSGTLDPGVTGVFPVGVGSGTKALHSLLIAGKEYLTLMRLHEELSERKIKKVLKKFTTKIYQTPPIKSNVKRVLRVREVYYTKLIESEGKDALFTVGSEAGTYIRRLCHDIGEVTGSGAHMQQLRRTRVANFNEDTLFTLQQLKDAFVFWKEGDEGGLRKALLPMESALSHLPKVTISDSAVPSVTTGAQLAVPGILSVESGISPGDLIAVLTQKGEGVLYGSALVSSEDMISMKKGLAVKTERVLMNPSIYSPK
ncbi:TPA: RNA-guided pseudouridylation complex pseudouridine synthase subunit Cbf5 [archaeon]|nr:RNA-guided pseudouridylation complex pseudouridine synthase subunit Cbf5 [Candidatus Undinarchaeales archaeon SRR5007147.bin71]